MRVRAFDWLRGLAVLVMIQTHALSLLRPGLHGGDFFVTLQWIDGLVAPAFIFAAGFAMALTQVRAAAGPDAPFARARRLRRTLRRIGEVLFVATLMNSMWFPIFREPRWLLRIDILQCIGLALLLALPVLSLLAPHPRALRWASLLLAALVFGVAPLAEHLPLPLGHFVNTASGSTFPLLPWAGYLYLGASVGAATAQDGAGGAVRWLLGLAAAGVAVWWATPQLAALYPPHEFWVTNPANCARRWTQVCGVALLLLAVERVPGAWRKSAPVRFVEVFGTSSLAAYFLHESLLFFRVFGFSFHRVWGDALGWPAYWAVLSLLILCTAILTWRVDKLYRSVDALIGA